jgi:hypothetical protein
MKRLCNGGEDKQIFQYLKIAVIQKTKALQEACKAEIFDIDSAIKVDTMF